MTTPTEQILQLSAPVECLQASASTKKPKLRILAYTGRVMNVSGWGPTLIDLSGLDLSKSTTILDGHQNVLDAVLGSGKAVVSDGQLVVMATLADTDAARTVLALLDSGVKLQASVGVRAGEVSDLAPGATVKVNGHDIEIDRHVTFIKSGVLEEVSLLPMGADGDTEVSLAARRAANSMGGNMAKDNEGTTSADMLQAERLRISEIDSILADWPAERSEAIKAGWTVDRANERGLHLLRASRPAVPSIHVNGGGSDVPARQIIASAILIRAGRSDAAEKYIGARACNAANELKCSSLYEIVRASLRLAGHDAASSGNRDEVIRAGLTTTSFPVALGDSISKMALEQYKNSPGVWRLMSKITTLNDFHSQSHIRPHFGNASMRLLAPGGEIRHTVGTEETMAVKADTYAEILGVSRTDIINDSVGAFSQYADSLARKGASTISDLVWTAILANTDNHFHANNANLVDDVLSIDGLSAAIMKMRKQSDASGKPLDISPRTLVVPPELEGLARQIVRSTEVIGGDGAGTFGSGTASPILPDLQLGIEPRISSTAFEGNSDTAWYLFASPADAPVIVGFLGGQESVTIEVLEPPANQLGMNVRGYFDCGVATPIGDFRAAVLSSGDAS